MAEHDALIPYPHNQEIVLRHRDSVIVYNPASKQLVARNAPHEDKLDLAECPLCHRAFRDGPSEDTDGTAAGATGPVSAPFASPEYFRMLSHSLPASASTSRAPSPRRRLMQRIRSGGAEIPEQTPPGTEFVGSSPAPAQHGISAAAFSPNYFSRFFVEEKELGRGGKGVVLLVKHVLDGVSLGHFALKRIPVGDDHKWLEKVLVEVQLLQHLSHQNLVSYRHVWLEDVQISAFGPSVPCAFVLQQYCNGGDLHNYVLQGMKSKTTKEQRKQRLRRRSRADAESPESMRPRRLGFEEIRSFFKDITAGLNHLHVNNYVHRDLKPSNCLLHSHGGQIRVLVSDFGEVQSETQIRNSSGATGTISYCAPEVLRLNPATGVLGNFTTKSDIFSLGMILYFLCFAKLPYRNADVLDEDTEDIDTLRAEIREWAGLDNDSDSLSELPDKIYRFLRRLLALDPNERPTADETLRGIRTGSTLDDSSESRSRSGSQVFDGSRRLSRISAVDTPTGSSPSRGGQQSMKRKTNRSDPPGPLQLADLHKSLENEFTIREGSESGDNGDRSPATSLVLHSGHTSPVKLSEPPEPIPITRKLLPAPRIDHSQAYKVAGLVLKIISIYFPCQPVAARPLLGLSLLGVAMMDLLIDGGYAGSLALLVTHISIVVGALYGNVLCLPKASMWDDLE